jgi:hypothetical protein
MPWGLGLIFAIALYYFGLLFLYVLRPTKPVAEPKPKRKDRRKGPRPGQVDRRKRRRV